MEQIYEFSTPKIFGATYKLSTLEGIASMFFHIQYVLYTVYPPLGDWGTLFFLSAQSIFHSYHMQVFFVLKVGGGIGIRWRWTNGFMVYNMVNKLSMFHIEYVNCIGEILFTVDSTTFEEIGKRYQSLQPKSLRNI